MGFSARGQAALFEIGKADDWGLGRRCLRTACRQEICRRARRPRLSPRSSSISPFSKYARFARGGRFEPAELSTLFDQKRRRCAIRRPSWPRSRGAMRPMSISGRCIPSTSSSMRLRQALLKARGDGGDRRQGCRQRPGHPAAHHQHGALALDAGGSRQPLCVEQLARVHAVRGQGRQDDLRRQDARRHASPTPRRSSPPT